MQKGQIINLIGTKCRPDVEDKLNRWMDEIHIPMLLKIKGLVSATRFKALNPSDEYPLYMTIYEFESKEAFEAFEASPEYAAATEETKNYWKPGERERVWRVLYQVMSKQTR